MPNRWTTDAATVVDRPANSASKPNASSEKNATAESREWRRRIWLVTGGCGFIGSHLVDALLARGDEARVLDNLSIGRTENLHPRAQLVRGDVADRNAVGAVMAGIDGCFHLAAVASVERGNSDWLGTHRTNLTGTVTVLDAARHERIPVVYASSAAVYGVAGDPPLSESAPTRPLSVYGADKLGCELHARVAKVVHRIDAVGLRFFNVYGPRQDPSSPYSGVISVFCDRLRSGRGIVIHGDGGQVRDFVYVDDVVQALLLAMARLPDVPALNVCTGRGTTILDLARRIAAQCRMPYGTTYRAAREGDIRYSVGDPAMALAHLGFSARTPLDDGLRRTLASTPTPRSATTRPMITVSERSHGAVVDSQCS